MPIPERTQPTREHRTRGRSTPAALLTLATATVITALALAACGNSAKTDASIALAGKGLSRAQRQELLGLISSAQTDAANRDGSGATRKLSSLIANVGSLRRSGALTAATANTLDARARDAEAQIKTTISTTASVTGTSTAATPPPVPSTQTTTQQTPPPQITTTTPTAPTPTPPTPSTASGWGSSAPQGSPAGGQAGSAGTIQQAIAAAEAWLNAHGYNGNQSSNAWHGGWGQGDGDS